MLLLENDRYNVIADFEVFSRVKDGKKPEGDKIQAGCASIHINVQINGKLVNIYFCFTVIAELMTKCHLSHVESSEDDRGLKFDLDDYGTLNGVESTLQQLGYQMDLKNKLRNEVVSIRRENFDIKDI